MTFGGSNHSGARTGRLASLAVAAGLAHGAAACAPEDSARPSTLRGPALERSVVVDAPLASGAPAGPTAPATGAPGAGAEGSIRTPTDGPERTGDGAARVGNVILLAPVRCGAVSVSEADPRPDCDAPALASGSRDGRQFIGAITFDLADLPPGSEILYAGLELVGMDAEFLADYGRWYLRLIQPPPGESARTLGFDALRGAPPAGPELVWRLRSGQLAPGGRNTLEFEAEARASLTARLGAGTVTFRIDGPSGRTNLFSWEVQGARAPRLRLAYHVARDLDATAEKPLILWDEPATPAP